MLQFDIRVTVRDPKTREPLDEYDKEDATSIQAEIESILDERIIKNWDKNRLVLLTISSSREVT